MKSYDLIVIGSGPAGEHAAALAASYDKSVALIERDVVPGGACTNTGTIPSKTLRESALHLSGFKQRGLSGLAVSMQPNITVSDFTYRKQEVVEKEWDLIEENLRGHGVDRFRGIARFGAPNAIIVDTSGYDEILRGEIILIATGSSPYRPANIPFDDGIVCDSDTILNLDRIPRNMAVVGAGVIGCEYASIFAALGIDVTLIDGRVELLSHVDREIVDMLMRQMRSRWRIQMQLGNGLDSLVREESLARLKLQNGRELKAEKVLYAAGRQSNTADLDLDKAGVVTGQRGIISVNENYQTNVPHVYAAGDVIGFPALASTSMEQGRAAVTHAFDLEYKTKLAPLLPYGIYTIPELSMIGLTEEDCLKRGMDYEIGRAYYRNNSRGQIIGDTSGMIKIVFDPNDHKLLGVHIIGENATDLIHVGVVTMQLGGSLDTFVQMVFNYPTLGDIYKYAAYDGINRLARQQRRTKLELEHHAVSQADGAVEAGANGAAATQGAAGDHGTAASALTAGAAAATAGTTAAGSNGSVQPAAATASAT